MTCPFFLAPDLRDHFGELAPTFRPYGYGLSVVVEVEHRQRLKDGLR